MRVEINKSDEIAALNAIKGTYLLGSPSTLVYDDSTTPITDTISHYTDALAAHATLVNPHKGYPPTTK